MIEPRHHLLSIRERWAVEILAGRKTVEVRRGAAHLGADDRLWLYAVAPVRAVVGAAVVVAAPVRDAEDVWRHYSPATAMSEREYWQYVREPMETVTAIGLRAPVRLHSPVTLDELGIPTAPRSRQRLGRRQADRLTAEVAASDPSWPPPRPAIG